MKDSNVMIDLETLSLSNNCVILSIGACIFDIHSGEIDRTFYDEPNVQVQINSGREISEQTVLWWMSQSEEAKKVFGGRNKRPLGNVIDNLRYFIERDSYVWSHGASFDIPIIEKLMPGHFKHYNVRDTRTLYWLADYSAPPHAGVVHNALDDALFQAKCVHEAYKLLKQK